MPNKKELLDLALSLVAKYGIENIDLAVELGKVLNLQESAKSQEENVQPQPAQKED